MSVYVGNSIYHFGRMIMCHMVADSIDELHEMADLIEIDRRHFQSKNKRYPHYDICKSKRVLALKHGAVEAESKTIVEICRKCGESIPDIGNGG